MVAVNVIANLLIVAGYVLVPIYWLPNLPLTTPVFVSGSTCFLTCAITHTSMAFNFTHHPAMVVNHVVQAVAVLAFVTGFARLLRIARGDDPALLPRRKRPRAHPVVDAEDGL